jgi:hypothetical protein
MLFRSEKIATKSSKFRQQHAESLIPLTPTTKTDIQHKHHKVDSNNTTISKTKFVMANCSEMHPHITTRWKLCRSFGQMPLPSNETDNGHMLYFNK